MTSARRNNATLKPGRGHKLDLTGNGYWLAGADGGVFSFGDAASYGSLGAASSGPIVGIVTNANNGYRLIDPTGIACSFGTNPS